jgi:hypothetical protein
MVAKVLCISSDIRSPINFCILDLVCHTVYNLRNVHTYTACVYTVNLLACCPNTVCSQPFTEAVL